MKILLLTPPFTQLNTPYPATMYLKGFLKQQGHEVMQADLGIELFNRIYSKKVLANLFDLAAQTGERSPLLNTMLDQQEQYLFCVEPVIRFLQGQEPTLATRICHTDFLPQGSRFNNMTDLEWAFGTVGITEKARHLATLFIEDIADFIKEHISPHFELGRYAEHLCLRVADFETLEEVLNHEPSPIDRMIHQLVDEKMAQFQPQMVGFSIPFPGNLMGALQAGRHIRQNYPQTVIVWGGGYVGTELRNLQSTQPFQYTDYIIADDGEPALLALIQYLECEHKDETQLHSTFHLNNQGEVCWAPPRKACHIPFGQLPAPDYSDLLLDQYISVIEVSNPMHKLWSDGRWNKLILAHGCYWAKCAFCDTTLPYIGCFETTTATALCDQIEQVMAQTGQSGFHFTDEAAPPKILRELSEEIIRRGLVISWWTNIRFEKSFTPELCTMMAQAGCIAVSGGLEVASNRLLKLINKGVTVEQAAQAAANLSEQGIMVHAYLMYGFPTQTFEETLDGLNAVRQLFEKGMLVSAFWHRYAMTMHSPSGLNPEKFGAEKLPSTTGTFANNEIPFTDHQTIDLDELGEGLRLATYNYMLGLGFDRPVEQWFNRRTPNNKKRKKR